MDCGFDTYSRVTCCRSGAYEVDDDIIVKVTKQMSELEKKLQQK